MANQGGGLMYEITCLKCGYKTQIKGSLERVVKRRCPECKSESKDIKWRGK